MESSSPKFSKFKSLNITVKAVDLRFCVAEILYIHMHILVVHKIKC